jgi:hypothetical protein
MTDPQSTAEVIVVESLRAPEWLAPPAASTESRPSRDGSTRESERLPFSRQIEGRTVVLPDLRVVFVPIPKAGVTTILWILARLAGLPLWRFAGSALAEPTPALTVHDMSLWEEKYRFLSYVGTEGERVLEEDGWFRFSVVRHPGTRLWSAWQSKLLLREPRFVQRFGDEPWFPRLPEEPDNVLTDFRRFIAALCEAEADDVHWTAQHPILEHFPLDHVGRVEQLDETLRLLRQHVGESRWPTETLDENKSLLPMPSVAFDAAAAAVVNERYSGDFERYGYEPVSSGPIGGVEGEDWAERVGALLPGVREVAVRNARVGQLHHTLTTVLKELSDLKEADRPLSKLENVEGEIDFNIRWRWSDCSLEPGFTAVVRVKNEARSLPWVIPPLLQAVQRVILIDNGSTDGSASVARRLSEEVGADGRLEVRNYPFSVSRCGPEHLETPAASVHSLTYFYNWSFAQVRTRYALKWDGDMVMSDRLAAILRDLAWQLEGEQRILVIPRLPLYVADHRRAFLDTALPNLEPWGWPNAPDYRFGKGIEWELAPMPSGKDRFVLPPWTCVELKYLDSDEFENWSHHRFDDSPRTRRKRRELAVFQALVRGDEPPDGVTPIEAPPGDHVINFVRSRWLRDKADGSPSVVER